MEATQELLIPDVGLIPKKTRQRPHGLCGDIELHYQIVLAADARGYRLRDLYYLAHLQCRKFSFESLNDEQLHAALAHVQTNQPPTLTEIENDLCRCPISARNPHHDKDCRYTMLIRLSDD